MKKFLMSTLVLFLLSFMMIGCGGGSGVTPNKVTQKDIKKIKLYDANGAALKGAKLTIVKDGATLKNPNMAARTITDNGDGTYTVEGYGDGKYKITVDVGNQVVHISMKIGGDNYQEVAALSVPLSVGADGSVSQVNGALVAMISGTVYSTTGVPIDNAQVSVSAGAATNGSFSSATTDTSGFYMLFINIKESLVENLDSLQVIVTATGYKTLILSTEDILNMSLVGYNIELTPATAADALYSEDFEGASANSWTAHKLTGTNSDNTWHIHTISDGALLNKAYVNNLVKLAPNDVSGGGLPLPKGNQCFWYGDKKDTSAKSFGSFLGVPSNPDQNNSGGISQMANSGELTSPPIDLSNASGSIKLTFDTYWEVESVNPNAEGFDFMRVLVTKDAGNSWIELARLNPKNDPIVNIDRRAIPFSNTGFNSAPLWLSQESIKLEDDNNNTLSGNTIQLKFIFDTHDQLYNGFRGWFIDNINISSGEGTFPKWGSYGSTGGAKTAENATKSTKRSIRQ